MSVQSEIDRLQTAKAELAAVLTRAGAAVEAGATLDAYPALFADVVQKGSTYLYKASFAVDGWSGSGPYTQTAAATPLLGAPGITAGSTMVSPPFIENDFPQDTLADLRRSGRAVQAGQKTLGAGTVTCTSDTLPPSDVEVFFLAKGE